MGFCCNGTNFHELCTYHSPERMQPHFHFWALSDQYEIDRSFLGNVTTRSNFFNVLHGCRCLKYNQCRIDYGQLVSLQHAMQCTLLSEPKQKASLDCSERWSSFALCSYIHHFEEDENGSRTCCANLADAKTEQFFKQKRLKYEGKVQGKLSCSSTNCFEKPCEQATPILDESEFRFVYDYSSFVSFQNFVHFCRPPVHQTTTTMTSTHANESNSKGEQSSTLWLLLLVSLLLIVPTLIAAGVFIYRYHRKEKRKKQGKSKEKERKRRKRSKAAKEQQAERNEDHSSEAKSDENLEEQENDLGSWTSSKQPPAEMDPWGTERTAIEPTEMRDRSLPNSELRRLICQANSRSGVFAESEMPTVY